MATRMRSLFPIRQPRSADREPARLASESEITLSSSTEWKTGTGNPSACAFALDGRLGFLGWTGIQSAQWAGSWQFSS